MFYTPADNQHVNNELLRRGSTTFGSYERRVSRLLRFLTFEYNQMNDQQKIIRALSQRRANKSTEQRLAAWTLLGLRYGKTESVQATIPLHTDANLSNLQNRGYWGF
jgi:hypothetical protein